MAPSAITPPATTPSSPTGKWERPIPTKKGSVCSVHSIELNDGNFIPAVALGKRLASWRALETAQRLGKVKSIGVSNFGVAHMQDLLEKARVVPAVNQVEVHPFCQREELVKLCADQGIKIEAYSPLARGNKLEDPTINAIAKKYGQTPAQILLNWNAARGNIVLPKSLTASRIQSNLESFEFTLAQEDIETINALGKENY
ncbi:hypothetical protein BN1723_014544, partial [Verticillium longisporum]